VGVTLHPSLAAVRRGVRAALEDRHPGDVVVVACSGGADSLALLSATVFEGRKLGLRIVGATIDHGLQEQSAEVAARVVEQMAALGADDTFTARVRVEAPGLGPEAAARRARYEVLDQIAERCGAGVVLLGHTRDDQAETVLLGLARGSGGRSLAGMRRAFDRYRRPLLDVARADTVTACQVEGLTWWEDPHNADPGYARVRVRRRVLPLLEEDLGPGVARTLARTADQLRADMDLLDDVAEAAYRSLTTTDAEPDDGQPGRQARRPLPIDGLAAQPGPIRTRVLRLAAVEAGAIDSELTYEHVQALDGLVTRWRGQRWIDLPGHLRAVRRDGSIHLDGAPRGDAG
jgi:tRNA(Ile)-lysidine synthase